MSSSVQSVPGLRVYFDGLCSVCSREIAMYRKQKGSEAIHWLDITVPGFDARAEGLDETKIHATFHVKTPDGRIVEGVDAFVEIWRTIPSLGFLAKASGLPGARSLLKLGYAGFARIRPYLPRKARGADCDTGVCR